MIGILLSQYILSKITKGKKTIENIDFYVKAADDEKQDICFYAIKNIQRNKNQVNGYIYSYLKQTFQKKTVIIPKVNLCRLNLRTRKGVGRLNKLEKNYGVIFINKTLQKDRNKYDINHYLCGIPMIRPHIPDTERLTHDLLQQFLQKYKTVYIKPSNGSLGSKIIKISSKGLGNNTTYVVDNQWRKIVFPKVQLPHYLVSRFKNPKLYHIQEEISAIEYEGAKCDFWNCSNVWGNYRTSN
ncbi:YheC/YheD family protein [Anaerobacillus sp. MEB173]|uniref:YheC/YheD family protein n=1 Tax=Anaerobacillus sp. MEB173 TaxID=3383345 RepID=UPI003F8F2BF5